MERRFACLESDLGPGASMTLDWDPPVALFRTEDGSLYATADTCTHEQWSLGADSDLEGNEVECPLHMARFDIRTGEALCFPATVALRTYSVEVDPDSKVYILI
ncbi:non-heme iron oxygenase ferredoxin subunit [Actinomadura madurae]|uniref:non-heme iron oxygenase ferredoxin subunit n=1 Tax=Actinomadura madurae TaxID=1993 RepID=UPI00399AC51A